MEKAKELMQTEIRHLQKEEQADALRLSLATFMECGKDDYDESGLEVFKSFINDRERIGELDFLGAFHEEKLVGTLAFRERGSHLSLFFILPRFHRRGIGRRLFDAWTSGKDYEEITVNASTRAVPFYESLGFHVLAEPQNYHGLISVPMKWRGGK